MKSTNEDLKRILTAVYNAVYYMDDKEIPVFLDKLEKWIADYMKKRALDDVERQLLDHLKKVEKRRNA